MQWPVPDLALERRHLAQADKLIVAGEMRATMQRFRLAELELAGRSTRYAQYQLDLFEGTLAAFYHHRAMILDAIDRAGGNSN